MKKITSLLLIVLYVIAVHAQWEWQNPLPQGNNLNSATFIDENNGWAVGNSGTILHTSDGGYSWDKQFTSQRHLLDVCFIDLNNGWAVGDSIIVHTDDGGTTWEIQDLLPNLNSISYYNVKFVNSSSGWIIGDIGVILHTLDGGNTWNEQISNTDNRLEGLFFADENNGWIVGRQGITLNTNNGGNTWVEQNEEFTHELKSVYFSDTLNGCAVGLSILYTNDGGISWEQASNGNVFGNFTCVYFTDALTGWAVGSSSEAGLMPHGVILHTIDGGESWEEQVFYGPEINSICMEGPNIGWIFGHYGIIGKTTNGGVSWEELSTISIRVDLEDIFFTDSLNGCVVGNLLMAYNQQVIFAHTHDGGMNWDGTSFNGQGAAEIRSIHFADQNNGWAVGVELWAGAALILHTADGGNSWESQLLDNYSSLHDVYFADTLTGWTVGEGGTILHTIDGGLTWEQQPTNNFRDLYSIDFINSEIGWIIGAEGTIYHTTNGGDSWVFQSSGTTADFNTVCFVDSLNGWISGTGGILHTVDGGISWNVQYYNGWQFKSIKFTDVQNGWVLHTPNVSPYYENTYTEILQTNDGGMNWTVQEIDPGPNLSRIFFTDDNNGWVIGSGGTIMHTNNGGISGSNEVIKAKRNKSLVNSFPNPFSTSTTITYELQHRSSVQINIYNHQGEIAKSLVNRNESKGIHHIKFNGFELGSGIYYLVLKTNEGVQTKKMIKL